MENDIWNSILQMENVDFFKFGENILPRKEKVSCTL